MTFLNPLVLFGLAAAAIPILLHLLNLRKLKTVEFSSLRFLKELQKTTMRRVRVKQWLLLALRTLLVIALVLAFARPALRGSLAGALGTHARTTSVVIMDDSPSTGVRNEQGIVFERARLAAGSLAGAITEGDELFLLPLSSVRHGETVQPLRDGGTLAGELKKMTVTEETMPYVTAFGVASRLLAESKNFNKEVYLFTDLQATQFTIPPGTDSADLFDDRVRVFLAGPAPGRADNIGITGIRLVSQILAPGKPAMVEGVVRNFGQTPLVNGVLSVYLDGARVVQRSIDLAAGGSASPSASVLPRRRGILAGSLRLEDDAFDPDNTRYYVLDIPAVIRILLVGGDAELRLLRLALAVQPDSAAGTAFDVQSIPEPGLSSTDIARFDVIACSGVQDFSPTEAARLAQFVTDGGGVMLFPGDRTDPANYSTTLLQQLGMPAIREIQKSEGTTAQGAGYSFRKVDYAHPLFAGLFEEGLGRRPVRPAVESPLVLSTLVVRAGERAQTVIELSNGGSFLTDNPAGAGRVLLFSVAADLTWSDFPLKGIFVPLLHRSVYYLASGNRSNRSFTVGEELQMTLRLSGRAARQTTYTIVAPDGQEERVIPSLQPSSGMATFTLARASTAGIYELRRDGAGAGGGEPLHAVAVNPDPAESDLRPADDAALENFWTRVGIQPEQVMRMQASPELDQAVQQSRFGVELWKYLVALAALLAVAEMLIGREPKEHASR